MADRHEMELARVRELVALMREHDLVEIELVDGERKIHLKRPQPVQPALVPMPAVPTAPTVAAPLQPAAAAPMPKEALLEITSPIIGTLYSAPGPDSEPYVKIGDTVKPDTTVCIIEAMKVMNEIKAEVSGTIVEILCQAGEPVEFGQVLFRLRPA